MVTAHEPRTLITTACAACGSSPNKGGAPIPDGIKAASPRQRRRTPIAFAAWLLEVAGKCSRERIAS